MKHTFTLIIFILFSSNIFAQKIQLKIVSANTPVQNATITDEHKKLITISNIEGVVFLEKDNYNLIISHVGYKNYNLNISITDTAKIIKVNLNKNIVEEPVITVLAIQKKQKLKKYSFGLYKYKSEPAGHISLTSGKLGVIIPYNLPQKDIYLKSLKFQLKNTKQSNKLNCKLEIKLYQILGDTIAFYPLNSKQILINFKDLKRNNTVSIEEKIILPKSKILISFEFYNLDKSNKESYIFFTANEVSDNCLLITNSVFAPNWQGVKIPYSCRPNSFTLKHQQFNIKLNAQNIYEN